MQTLNNGEALGTFRGILNSNFSELTPKAISFVANVPFVDFKSLMIKRVDADIVFTPNKTGAKTGAIAQAILIADGVHVPSFVAFYKTSLSDNYSNTAGDVNIITFERNAIGQYTYSIEIGPSINTKVPISWGNLLNVTNAGNGTLNGTSTPAPAGANTEETMVPGSAVEFTISNTPVNSDAVALALSDTLDTDYLFYTQPVIGMIYTVSGNVYTTEGPTDSGDINMGAIGANKVLRMEWLGNDLLYRLSVDGITYTTIKTSAGLMTGKALCYIKAMFVVNGVSKTMITARGIGLI